MNHKLMLQQDTQEEDEHPAIKLKHQIDTDHYQRARAVLLEKEKVGERFGPGYSYR